MDRKRLRKTALHELKRRSLLRIQGDQLAIQNEVAPKRSKRLHNPWEAPWRPRLAGYFRLSCGVASVYDDVLARGERCTG